MRWPQRPAGSGISGLIFSDSKAAGMRPTGGFAFIPQDRAVPRFPSHGIGRAVELGSFGFPKTRPGKVTLVERLFCGPHRIIISRACSRNGLQSKSSTAVGCIRFIYSLQTPRRPPTAGFSFIRSPSEFGRISAMVPQHRAFRVMGDKRSGSFAIFAARAGAPREAQAAFPHGFVTWANRPLSNNGQSMPPAASRRPGLSRTW